MAAYQPMPSLGSAYGAPQAAYITETFSPPSSGQFGVTPNFPAPSSGQFAVSQHFSPPNSGHFAVPQHFSPPNSGQFAVPQHFSPPSSGQFAVDSRSAYIQPNVSVPTYDQQLLPIAPSYLTPTPPRSPITAAVNGSDDSSGRMKKERSGRERATPSGGEETGQKEVVVTKYKVVQTELRRKVEIPVDKIVPVEKIIEQIVHRRVDQVVEKISTVEVPHIVEDIVEVPIESIVHVEVPVERIIEKKPRIVERIVQIPVEKIVYVEVPVERMIEKITYQEPRYESVQRVVQVPKIVMQDQVIEELVQVGTQYKTRASTEMETRYSYTSSPPSLRSSFQGGHEYARAVSPASMRMSSDGRFPQAPSSSAMDHITC